MKQTPARIILLLISLTIVTLQRPDGMYGQTSRSRNSLGASYSGIRTLPLQQYIGAGIEYRYMHRPWLGVQIQVSDFPQTQQFEQNNFGGAIVQTDAVLLVGRQFGKVTLLGEGGFGILRSHVFSGLTNSGTAFAVRNYPELLLGGFIDVSLGRRWSLTFDVRDNMSFLSSSVVNVQSAPFLFVEQGGTVNSPEGRAGFAFHF